MSWNNASERKKFNAKIAKEVKEYEAAGMSDEQIKSIVEFDENQFRSDRRFRMHTQELCESDFDDEDGGDDGKSPLYEKYMEQLTVSIEDEKYDKDRFSWIDAVQNVAMYEYINSLSDDLKELLTLLIEEKTETEIAKHFGVSQQAISKKIKKIQIIFSKWL